MSHFRPKVSYPSHPPYAHDETLQTSHHHFSDIHTNPFDDTMRQVSSILDVLIFHSRFCVFLSYSDSPNHPVLRKPHVLCEEILEFKVQMRAPGMLWMCAKSQTHLRYAFPAPTTDPPSELAKRASEGGLSNPFSQTDLRISPPNGDESSTPSHRWSHRPKSSRNCLTICLQNRFRPAGRTDSLSTPGTVSHVSRRHQIVSRPFLASQNRN